MKWRIGNQFRIGVETGVYYQHAVLNNEGTSDRRRKIFSTARSSFVRHVLTDMEAIVAWEKRTVLVGPGGHR